MLRVGRIDYANCSPLFMQFEEQLKNDAIDIVHGVPAVLNQQLADGMIDICISSSIEYIKHPGKYLIVPDNCIGSDGAVQSVLLFSRCPVEHLAGSDVMVTSESATSVILLQILFKKYWGLEGVRLLPTPLHWKDALAAGAQALLLIGDSALRASYAQLGIYCYDLGTTWKMLTGHPFVYALWMANRATITNKTYELGIFRSLLDAARDSLYGQAPVLAERASERSWMTAGQLIEYWRHAITYHLDAEHLSGLRKFYRFAAELELVDSEHELEFLKV